eukprot:gnl/MRDRNA2_/MRDRNA2_28724_c0_seq1.p1 gnl/MRDRNA2_/MRDRNA2_28724_c0~~gnl/MRDRNA2_/MRDRNA2_28724_c0_seq1.p1  ORF type:complete len:337 (-),score=77.67 gnl/MRDRNA2_/MRDRNA2_28724_c0_seq1:73-1083(-)
MHGTIFKLLLTLLVVSAQVTPQDYAAWFSSSQGLQMTNTAASWLAQNQAATLNACGVTIDALQALRNVLFNGGSNGLGLRIDDVQKDILILAEQHVEPTALNQIYQILIGGWWRLPGGLTLPVELAQPRAIEMAKKHVEPQNLKDIYAVLFGYSGGILLPQTRAQQVAMEAATAGVDVPTFQSAYTAQTKAGASQDDALKAAEKASVAANLHSLVRRYAKDGNLYTADEYQKYYYDNWLFEWMVAPEEKRVHYDGKAYRASEYEIYFGTNWFVEWAKDKEATQVRHDFSDGHEYTMIQFQQFYKNDWQIQWAASAEVACKECTSPVAMGTKEMLVV